MYRRVLAALALCAGLAACVPPDTSDPTVKAILQIGRCEQPGHGWQGIAWDTHGSRYSGGLGFLNATWTQYREPWMPANAGDATPLQQILVAEKLHDRYGWRPWGCRTAIR